MPVHVLHGLVVDSPLKLPAAPAGKGQAVDVTITVVAPGEPRARGHRIHPVVARMDDRRAGRRHELTGTRERWVLDLPDTARVWGGAPGDLVVIEAAADVDDELLVLLIAGPVLTALCLMRGVPLLHASAVDSARGVVLAVGPSGTGKSTVARLLVDGGAGGLFSDDSTRVDLSDAGAYAFSGTLTSRLRSTVLVDKRPAGPGGVGRSADARVTVSDPTALPLTQRPVSLIVAPVLTPAATKVSVQPVTGALAAALASDSEPLSGLVESSLRTEHFRHCSRLIAAGVKMAQLIVPWRNANADMALLASELADAVTEAQGLGGGR